MIMHPSSTTQQNDCVNHLRHIRDNGQPPSQLPGFPENWRPIDGNWSIFSEVVIPSGMLVAIERDWPGTIAMMAKAAWKAPASATNLFAAICDDLSTMSLADLTCNGHAAITQIAVSTWASVPSRFAALDAIAPALQSLDVAQLFSQDFRKNKFIGWVIKAAYKNHDRALVSITETLAQATIEQLYPVFYDSPVALRMLLSKSIAHHAHLALADENPMDKIMAEILEDGLSADFSGLSRPEKSPHSRILDEMENNLVAISEQTAVSRRVLQLITPALSQLTMSQIVQLESRFCAVKDTTIISSLLTSLVMAHMLGRLTTIHTFAPQFENLTIEQFRILEQNDYGFLRSILLMAEQSHKYLWHISFHQERIDGFETRYPAIFEAHQIQKSHAHQFNILSAVCNALHRVVSLDDLISFERQSLGLIATLIGCMMWYNPFQGSRLFIVKLLAHYAEQYLRDVLKDAYDEHLPNLEILAYIKGSASTISSRLLMLEHEHPGLLKKLLMFYGRPHQGNQLFIDGIDRSVNKVTQEHGAAAYLLEAIEENLSVIAMRIVTLQLGDLAALISTENDHTNLILIEKYAPGTIRAFFEISPKINDPHFSLRVIYALLVLKVDLAWIEHGAPGTIRTLLNRELNPIMLFSFSLVMGDLLPHITRIEAQATGTVLEITKAIYRLTKEPTIAVESYLKTPQPIQAKFISLFNDLSPIETYPIGLMLCAIVQQSLSQFSFDQLCDFTQRHKSFINIICRLSVDRAQHGPLQIVLDCLVDASKAVCEHSSDDQVLERSLQAQLAQLYQASASAQTPLRLAVDQYVDSCTKKHAHIPESLRLFSVVSKRSRAAIAPSVMTE